MLKITYQQIMCMAFILSSSTLLYTMQPTQDLSFEVLNAVVAGNSQKTAQLLEQGAQPDTQDGQGWPLLQLAVFQQSQELCNVLLDSGAQIDLLNNKLQSPLSCAAAADTNEFIPLLLYKAQFWPQDQKKEDVEADDSNLLSKNEIQLQELVKQYPFSWFKVHYQATRSQESDKKDLFDRLVAVTVRYRLAKIKVILQNMIFVYSIQGIDEDKRALFDPLAIHQHYNPIKQQVIMALLGLDAMPLEKDIE